MLASEFAAPVPADSPPTDTSLNPLPSTGPYEITSYQPTSRILEQRNPHFKAWRFDGNVPAGNPDRVTWDIVPNASAALHRVLTGKDDWMSYYQVPGKRLPAIEKKHKSRLRTFTPPNLMYFFMNTRVPPFTSLKVRRAVNYAISRRWLKRLAGGLAHTTENILPPGYPSFRAHTLYRHDLRKAKRLVRESGYEGKRVFVWNHDVPGDRPFTQYLVQVLDQIGFHATEKIVTAGSYWATIGNQKTRAQIGFADFVQDYPHPLDWFRLLDGRAITQIHNSNYANFDVGWANRRDRGAHTPDGADAEGQQRLGGPRPESDAPRSVGSVPQPGGDGLLQRPRRPRLLREQRPVRVRLREHLRQQQIGPNCVNKSVFQ